MNDDLILNDNNNTCNYRCDICDSPCDDALTCNACGCLISEEENNNYGEYCSGC